MMNYPKNLLNSFILASAYLSNAQAQSLIETLQKHQSNASKPTTTKSPHNPLAHQSKQESVTATDTLKAANSYLDVLEQQSLLALAQASLELQKDLYQQLNSDTTSSQDQQKLLEQALKHVLNAENSYLTAQSNLKTAESNYTNTIGTKPEQLSAAPTYLKAFPSTLKNALELALANQGHDNIAKQPALIPTVQSNQTGNNTITQTLFGNPKHKHSHNQTAFEMYQAKNSEEISYKRIVESMPVAWETYEQSIAKLPGLITSRDIQIHKLQALKQQAPRDKAGVFGIINASQSLYQTDASLIKAQYEVLKARYAVLASMNNLPPSANSITASTHSHTLPSENLSVHDLSIYQKVAIIKPQATATKPPSTIAMLANTVVKDAANNQENANGDIEAIQLRLQAWAEAWSRSDIDDYLSFYPADFQPSPVISHEQWKQTRLNRIKPEKEIKVSVAQLKIETDKPSGSIKSRFQQHYHSKTFQDIGFKEIIWKKDYDTWLIQSERDIPKTELN